MRSSALETLRRWSPEAAPGRTVWPWPRTWCRRPPPSRCSFSSPRESNWDPVLIGALAAIAAIAFGAEARLKIAGRRIFRCEHRPGALDARDRRALARAPRLAGPGRDQPLRDPPRPSALTRSRRHREQLRARDPRRLRNAPARRRSVDRRSDARSVHDRAPHVRRQLPVRATHLCALLPGLPAERPGADRVPRDDASVRGHARARCGDRRADRAAGGVRARAAGGGSRPAATRAGAPGSRPLRHATAPARGHEGLCGRDRRCPRALPAGSDAPSLMPPCCSTARSRRRLAPTRGT